VAAPAAPAAAPVPVAAAAPPPPAPAPAESAEGRFRALYSYDAADTDEVSFAEGDIIVNGVIVADGWMQGTVEKSGETGLLPSNYVEPA